MGKNIVLIFTDQMHKYALGKVSDYVKTPNLDRLCENGILFTDNYSNCPICGPYRGNLFSGMYTSHNQVINNGDPLPKNIPAMADAFNKGGYETSFVGKWHLGGGGNNPITEDIRGGFRHFIGYQCYNGFHENVCFYDEADNEYHYNEHRTDVTTQLAIERLKMLHKTGKSFLHVIGYQAPHYPVQPSPKYEKLYEGIEFPYEVDYQEVDPYTPTYSPASPRPFEECSDYQKYGNNMKEYLRLYYAMVSQVDDGVGQILHTLEELNIKDDTVIIFTSDHGDMQGSHGFKNKVLPYEKSCGTPLIVSVPDGIKNQQCSSPVSAIDLYPTCLDYANLPHETHLQGNSFAPYTLGYKQNIDWPVYAELLCSEKRWKMVRTQRYKLTVDWDSKQPYLLFDMQNDPFEMNNLINDHEYENIVNDLTSRIMSLGTIK